MKKGYFLFLVIVLCVFGFYACSENKEKASPKPIKQQAQPGGKVQKIVLIELTESGISDIFKQRMAADLAGNGLIESKDYIVKAKSALGDNASLISLIDAAKKEKPDLLITFQPQTLFVAIKKAPELDKVFGIVTDPFILGGGKSDTDHLPNLTGLYMDLPYDKLASLLSKLNPAPKTLGLLYLSGEDNSVKRMENMSKALAPYGIKLIARSYTTQSEINSAANVLIAKKPDGVIKLPDSNQELVLAALKPLARKTNIPLYSFGRSKDNIESSISVLLDYDQVARIFWNLAARALKGEELARIPFESSKNVKVIFRINKKEFDAYKIKIPDEALKEAVVIQQ